MDRITEPIYLKEPACGADCDPCNAHCAGLIMLMLDLRRSHEQVLREMSLRPRPDQREELASIEGHLGTAQLAFERVRPRKGLSRPTQEEQQMSTSALLH